jgi:hypothetical protein
LELCADLAFLCPNPLNPTMQDSDDDECTSTTYT